MAEDFINQVKQAISQGVSTLSQGVSELNSTVAGRLEMTKLQIQADALNRQMLEQMEKLGRTVYEGWQDNALDGPAVRAQCETLRGLESQTTALEEQIARLRAGRKDKNPDQPVCAACGEPLQPGARFCHACGKEVEWT